MAEAPHNSESKTGPRASARSGESDQPLWAGREVDIDALRRWFVRRIAMESLAQIKKERKHEHEE
jgi:hypothetical protein